MEMEVKEILHQYLGAVPLRNFRWTQKAMSNSSQKLLLDTVLNHEISRSYPPSIAYRSAFLKYVISQAEKSGQEVEEELYVFLTDLLSTPHNLVPDCSFKSYNLGGDDFVTIKESGKLVSHGTTGLTTWQAAFSFVEWILASQTLKELNHKTVLELGCGLGFVGVAICRLCKLRKYIFTDCHEHVLERLKENIHINLKGETVGSAEVKQLDWTREEDSRQTLDSLGNQLDFVFATGKKKIRHPFPY